MTRFQKTLPSTLLPTRVPVLFLLLLLSWISSTHSTSPVVSTDKGQVRGETHSVHYRHGHIKREVDVFYGIPYAKPPIGDLRFMHPEQIDSWDDVKDATVKPNACLQEPDLFLGDFKGSTVWNPNTNRSEDCLYLNVWSPRDEDSQEGTQTKRPANRAVMVWIYGGSFMTGSSALDVYDGKYLAAHEDVVVVSMQFRFGALGYLVLGSPDSPGNAGMMDIRMALEWVQRNIHKFGGSAHNVTLVGESSGAVSAGLFMLSSLGRGLFHRSIMQSASPLSPWGTTTLAEGISRSRRLAEKLGCDINDKDSAILQCLQQVPGHLFPQKEAPIVNGYAQFPFVPIVDGTFLTKTPQEYLEEGNFKKIPLLLGSNANEGTWLLVYTDSDRFNHTTQSLISRENHKKALDSLFHYHPQYPTELNHVAKEAINFQYTDWRLPDNQETLRSEVEQSVGDYNFVCGVTDMARIVASHNQDVYVYNFAHRSVNTPWPEWMGVLHGDEVFYMFGDPLKGHDKEGKPRSHINYTPKEKHLSRKMMKYWANFAKTGDPNHGPGEIKKEVWPRYTESRQRYLDITLKLLDGHQSSVKEGLRPRHCAFWRNLVPKLAHIGNAAYSTNCTRPSASTSDSATSITANSTSFMLQLLLFVVITTACNGLHIT